MSFPVWSILRKKKPLCRGDRQKAEERELYSDCTHYYEKV